MDTDDANEASGLYIALLSVHGLVRGAELELGRDADTGGQTKYVVELARALGHSAGVARVDLITRQVFDGRVVDGYAEPVEELGGCARIVRLPFGPRRYLRKETLWPHLPSLVDQALQHFLHVGRPPDVLHGHYADAGLVAARLAGVLGVPMVFTAHSLGHGKRARLAEKGWDEARMEKRFQIGRRIEAEEIALDYAVKVVASTTQEIEEQYRLYDNFDAERAEVIPPGVDLDRFRPPRRGDAEPFIAREIDRFLERPRRPLVLAISRADVRKNLAGLLKAYGEDAELREQANLAIVAGTRDDLEDLDKEARDVIAELLYLVDRYDLYGKVALPKQHRPEDVPELYRLAARRRGVFVNAALTEPFGLTLLEAAASGLPVVATDDGGPREILSRCRNGVLVNAFEPAEIAARIREVLKDRSAWRGYKRRGLSGVRRHFSWDAHVSTYLKSLRRLMKKKVPATPERRPARSPMPSVGQLIVCDIDGTLIGDREGLRELLDHLGPIRSRVGFGVATGRHIDSAAEVLEEWGVPAPDFLITSVGSEIHYGPSLTEEAEWARHIDYQWDSDAVRSALKELRGLSLQPADNQRRFKVSYFLDESRPPTPAEVRRHLRRRQIHATLVWSHDAYLDVLPVRASKGRALRHVALRWGVPLERVFAAGDSGNDEEMLTGDVAGIVVGNHCRELRQLKGQPRVYFAQGHFAKGVLEGLEHYAREEQEGDASGREQQEGEGARLSPALETMEG